MNERRIVVNYLPNRPGLILDKSTGVLTPIRHEVLPVCGSCAPVEGKNFCMYEEDARLFLQLDARRWEIESGVAASYCHDFDRKVTTFSIGDLRVEYEAWWAHDPGFNKFAPEQDEIFDFLGYVYQLWLDDSRRQDLILRWAANTSKYPTCGPAGFDLSNDLGHSVKMGINKGERFGREDIYVDYSFEEVMFRWDHTERKIYRRFYGKVENGPVPHDNRLFNDALRYGDETTRDKYLNGKRRSTYVTKFMLRSSLAARILMLFMSLALYISSLYLPAMCFEKEPPLYGMSVLAQGWFGLLTLNPSWLANPLYVAAIAQFVRRRYASGRLLSLIAVGCALCSLWTSEWDFNEAYGTPIKHLGAAFYTWLIALLVLLIGTEYLRRSGSEVPGSR